MTQIEVQSLATSLQGNCGIRKSNLEVGKIYYLHEFKGGVKQGVWLVKYLKNTGTERIFEKKTHEGRVRLTWNNKNEYMCSCYEYQPNKYYVSIISDR